MPSARRIRYFSGPLPKRTKGPLKLKKAKVIDTSTPELKRERIAAITKQLRTERKLKPVWPQIIKQLTEERARLKRELVK